MKKIVELVKKVIETIAWFIHMIFAVIEACYQLYHLLDPQRSILKLFGVNNRPDKIIDEFLNNEKVFSTMLPLRNERLDIIKVESMQFVDSNNGGHSLIQHPVASLKHIFVMITGNPGVCHIYEPYCTLLYSKLQKEFQKDEIAVIAVSFTAHSLSDEINSYYQQKDQQQTFTIEEQIEHKRLLLLDLIQKYPNTKIHLMGHSVGSYVICNVIHRLSQDVVNKHFGLFFLLFPTIQNMIDTPNAQSYQFVFGNYSSKVFSRIVSSVFGYSPAFLKRKFSAMYVNKKENNGSPILRACFHLFLQYPLLLNVTTLTQTEFSDIQSIDNVLGSDKEMTKTLLEKARWVTCDNDGWCPKEHIQMIDNYVSDFNARYSSCLWKDEVEKKRYIVNRSDCNHAFCIHEHDVDVVSDFVIDNVRHSY